VPVLLDPFNYSSKVKVIVREHRSKNIPFSGYEHTLRCDALLIVCRAIFAKEVGTTSS